MVDTSEVESYLNGKSAKDGDIVVITGAGNIEEKEDLQTKRKFRALNLPVELNTRALTFSPNKTAIDVFNKAWGTKTEAWLGKKFQVKTYPTPKGIAILPIIMEAKK
jgi:hypothetical protein